MALCFPVFGLLSVYRQFPEFVVQGLLFAGTANLVALRWLLLLGANPKDGQVVSLQLLVEVFRSHWRANGAERLHETRSASVADTLGLSHCCFYQALPKARDRNGTTLLHAACRSGSFLVAQARIWSSRGVTRGMCGTGFLEPDTQCNSHRARLPCSLLCAVVQEDLAAPGAAAAGAASRRNRLSRLDAGSLRSAISRSRAFQLIKLC